MRIALVLALVVAVGFTAAANLHGTIFNYEFSPVPAVIVVNTTPNQVVVAPNGTYSVDVDPGTYAIKVIGRNNKSESQQVTIGNATGSFTVDFMLLDSPDADASAKVIEGLDGTLEAFPESQAEPQNKALLWALAAIAVIAGAAYLLFLRKPGTAAGAPTAARDLPEEEEVLAAVAASGGIMTQKELRKKLTAWSEARVSTVVGTLEASGKLKKIKRGRGNLLRLP